MSIEFPNSAASNVVLIVEDEPVLRASMSRGLGRLPQVEVVDAGNVRDAKKLIAACRPDMLVSDLDLPDGSGIDLLGELDRAQLRVPVLIVSAYVPAYRGKLPSRHDVEVLEKPVAMETLRQHVAERIGRPSRVDASPFGVADYVQLAGMGRRSVVLEIESSAGSGRIFVRGGEIWSAEDGKGDGMDAFRRLAFLENANIACRSLRSDELGDRTIEGSCDGVLLEAARLADENAPIEEAVDDWEAPPASGAMKRIDAERAFADAYERGVDALLVKNHRAAFEAFREASDLMPGDPRVVANLTRLRAMGFS